ncbi:hypothetical protein GOP47_0017851 [Adiantum capillus-veneris]|uniref:Protein kinase domain-containing protein n=1 Tax=Adiantum capillus-veneris TaxID=13818 RepID=A0A9D4UH18_ADICA|nr:hypothetical protein GOP47_0017851 [Adiantum capillus-veneris]
MGNPCISYNALSSKTVTASKHTENVCLSSKLSPPSKDVQLLKHRNFLPHKSSKAGNHKIKKNPSTTVVNSLHFDTISNLAGAILPESGFRLATPSLHSIATNLRESIPSLSSLATNIAGGQDSLFNHVSEAFHNFTDHFLHTLAAGLIEPSHIAFLSSPTVSAASIFVTLTTSAIALKSLNKEENSALSLSNLSALKERLLKLQSTVSKVHPQSDAEDAEEALPLHYDTEAISEYYTKRPLLVLSRACFVLLECSIVLVNILMDNALGKAKQNESLRASQLVNLITRLGPTAVKVGQALSIRPDLLSPTYLEELQKLQDCVPPFSSEEAKRMVFEGLGIPIEDVYSQFSEEPIAAASLGQVYKAKLRDTEETVAVKVQRPDVLSNICLDLFIVRALAMGWQRLPNRDSSDLLSFIDHWASHFFQELDYIQEAKNMEEFSKNMRSLPNVIVPKAITQHTSRKVLTTTWISGEKLSDSKEADIPQLVSVALNCYLIQLLESGFLHADPHPGNLLRTTDGRLCVLDFGLMIQVTEEQRYALIDYISHLMNSDYEKVADDLIKLGFLPPHLVHDELATKILPQLSRVLSQLVKGGGLQQMDIQQIIADLAQMASQYSIVIPPYFAMILRAFSILEGIGLKNNPNYVIIDECYPYICKRLLTDDSPRARTALKYFLYGKRAQLDAHRVEAILKGFQNFRKTMSPTNMSRGSRSLDPTSQQILESVLAPEGSFLQELLLAEVVRIVDALSREAVFELWNTFVGFALPLSRYIPLPLSIPITGFFGISPTYSLSEEDQEALTLVRRLGRLLGSEMNRQTVTEMTTTTHSITALFPEFAGGMATASARFWFMLLHRKALRFADDLDGRNSLMYWNMDPAASARKCEKPELHRTSIEKQLAEAGTIALPSNKSFKGDAGSCLS